MTPKPLTFGEMTQPRQYEATRDYIHQVANELDLDSDTAEKVADYIVNEIERTGGSDARLVFVAEDGSGPYCSWCWGMAGICPHIAGGASEHVQNGPDGPVDR